MITVPPGLRVFLACGTTDMRLKGRSKVEPERITRHSDPRERDPDYGVQCGASIRNKSLLPDPGHDGTTNKKWRRIAAPPSLGRKRPRKQDGRTVLLQCSIVARRSRRNPGIVRTVSCPMRE